MKDIEQKIQNARNMLYDWSQERDVMHRIQRVQRNWDYDKWDTFSEECNELLSWHPIQELLWVAQNSPSKQHEGYYDLYWSADRKVIHELSRYTWGNTHRREPPSNWRNSQADASLYIIWVAKEPDTQMNSHSDGTLKSNKDHERWLNSYVSIGISLGLTMRAAAKMGLSTGCNKNMNDLNGDMFWENKLGIYEEVIKAEKKVAYGLGVGFPQEGRDRWESDETELMIGAANGSSITLIDQERHPIKDKKMRKAKIIDIEKHGGEEITDHYGNVHTIPTGKPNFRINSFRDRGIKITEIK